MTIIEQSEQAIGRVWTAEDHARLERQIKAIEETAIKVVERTVDAMAKRPA